MSRLSRRTILGQALALLPSACLFTANSRSGAENKKEEEVSPAEDLMREHGALNRMLLIYDHVASQLKSDNTISLKPLGITAALIREFIENYHEKLEENYLFPRFEKAGKMTDLVSTLRAQHDAGRMITAQVLEYAKKPELDSSTKLDLSNHLHAFVRMYRPHEAREDTVLFPAFKGLVGEAEYKELGEMFEDQEHKLFGEYGFDKKVEQIAAIERELGIYDLAQFTANL